MPVEPHCSELLCPLGIFEAAAEEELTLAFRDDRMRNHAKRRDRGVVRGHLSPPILAENEVAERQPLPAEPGGTGHRNEPLRQVHIQVLVAPRIGRTEHGAGVVMNTGSENVEERAWSRDGAVTNLVKMASALPQRRLYDDDGPFFVDETGTPAKERSVAFHARGVGACVAIELAEHLPQHDDVVRAPRGEIRVRRRAVSMKADRNGGLTRSRSSNRRGYIERRTVRVHGIDGNLAGGPRSSERTCNPAARGAKPRTEVEHTQRASRRHREGARRDELAHGRSPLWDITGEREAEPGRERLVRARRRERRLIVGIRELSHEGPEPYDLAGRGPAPSPRDIVGDGLERRFERRDQPRAKELHAHTIAYARAMPSRPAVGAIVFDDDGRVLLVKRGRPPLANTWSLPGGKVVAHESFATAIAREVLEETGLVVDPVREVAVVTLVLEEESFEIHEWLCTLRVDAGSIDAPLRPGDDAVDVRWASQAEFGTLELTTEVIALIADARAPRDSQPT